MTIDAVVAGAGIWGCMVARRQAEAGRKVLVLEKRPVVNGNMRCEFAHGSGLIVSANNVAVLTYSAIGV